MHTRKINLRVAVAAIQNTLIAGGVGVLPTDTLYGIVGSARNRTTVQRIYRLRKRDSKKPMIILIASIDDMAPFGVRTTTDIKKILKKVWPGAVSVVLPTKRSNDPRTNDAIKKFAYLHRGTKTLAFRVPKPLWLRGLLAKTGPLFAPSANVEGKPPAKTVREAKKYFGDSIQFYIDAGKRTAQASTLIKFENGAPVILRKGATPVPRAFLSSGIMRSNACR